MQVNVKESAGNASGKHVREMYNPYIVKMGYAGEYLFFLFLLKSIDCGNSLEPPRCTNV